MLENFTVTTDDIWSDIEPVISKLRYEEWVDPILKDKFEALLNNYNGTISANNTTAILGKLESISTMLSMESYYRTRNTSDKEKKVLLDLNENFLLLRQVLNGEQREKEKAEHKAVEDFGAEMKKAGENRLPNLDTDREQILYGDGKNKKILTR